MKKLSKAKRVAPVSMVLIRWYQSRLISVVNQWKTITTNNINKGLVVDLFNQFKIDDALSDFERLSVTLQDDLNATMPTVARYADDAYGRTDELHKQRWRTIINATYAIDPFLLEDWQNGFIRAFVNNNVLLMKNASEDMIKGITQVVLTGAKSGVRPAEIQKQIQKQFNVTKSRARLIARDQVSKLYGQINRQRQADIGVVRYQWGDSDDSRVRHSHALNDNKIMQWKNNNVELSGGKWVTRAGYKGVPGEDYQCRCVAYPFMPERGGEAEQTKTVDKPVVVKSVGIDDIIVPNKQLTRGVFKNGGFFKKQRIPNEMIDETQEVMEDLAKKYKYQINSVRNVPKNSGSERAMAYYESHYNNKTSGNLGFKEKFFNERNYWKYDKRYGDNLKYANRLEADKDKFLKKQNKEIKKFEKSLSVQEDVHVSAYLDKLKSLKSDTIEKYDNKIAEYHNKAKKFKTERVEPVAWGADPLPKEARKGYNKYKGTVAHEVFHAIDHQNGNLSEEFRQRLTLKKIDLSYIKANVSTYGGSSWAEAFAEVGSAYWGGKKLPKDIKSEFLKVLKKAEK